MVPASLVSEFLERGTDPPNQSVSFGLVMKNAVDSSGRRNMTHEGRHHGASAAAAPRATSREPLCRRKNV
jgi:hypothetical protein